MISRRALLYLASAGSAVLALYEGGLHLHRSGRAEAETADAGGSQAFPHAVEFLAALFGETLSGADRADLTERLTFSVGERPSLGAGYVFLARRLDELAQEFGARDFFAASDAQRQAVVDRIMQIPWPHRAERIVAFFSTTRRLNDDMRVNTVPQLAWLYRNSSVAWRMRGYARWPGMPGDWHETLTAARES